MFDSIHTPAYVADRKKIRKNLEVASYIKRETGCKILLATKAFSMFSLFSDFAAILDGTTASGLYEAELGHRHFGGEVHAYSPAFTQAEIESLKPICGHISFNSVAQLQHYGNGFPVKGLRLNPRLSLVKNNSMYDPSSPCSRFGVDASVLTQEVLAQMNLLHVHNLCENLAEDSVRLFHHVMELVPHALDSVDYVNMGGGHYITHPDYDVGALIEAIRQMQEKHGVTVILEPGGALVYDTGYLVSTVVDIIENGGEKIAILDTSATCHMPDVLEVPYRPRITGDNDAHPHRYIITGKTCLTGDHIGIYHFAAPLKAGQKLVFEDMMQYTMVKNTTFNGLPLPDIAILEENGSYRVVKSFNYNDFEMRLS